MTVNKKDWNDAELEKLLNDIHAAAKGRRATVPSLAKNWGACNRPEPQTAFNARMHPAVLGEYLREQVEGTPFVKQSCPPCATKEMVRIEDVVAGDEVFEYAASEHATVLYVHDGDYFTSIMAVRGVNAPFIIQRHAGAYIYRKVKC